VSVSTNHRSRQVNFGSHKPQKYMYKTVNHVNFLKKLSRKLEQPTDAMVTPGFTYTDISRVIASPDMFTIRTKEVALEEGCILVCVCFGVENAPPIFKE